MTSQALDIVSKNPKGFFMMAEGGRIDQALHPTLAQKALQDAEAFDDAIKATMAKVQTFDPGMKNTPIVVTADHVHTMAFNGYGMIGSPILGNNINYQTKQLSVDKNGASYLTLVFGNGEKRVDTRVNIDTKIVESLDYH